jgi:hypothetical protein
MKENPEACGFKHPVYYPRDKVTLEIVPGKSPSLYLALSIRKDAKTMFCGLDEQPISWDLLKNVSMSFVPLVQFEKIYVGGGKPSLQMKLVSAVVTSVVSKSSLVRQKSTIERLKQSRELCDTVARQIEALKQNNGSDESTNTGKQEHEDTSPTVEEQEELSPPRKPKFTSSKPASSRLQDFLKNT